MRVGRGETLVLATHNAGKLGEMAGLLAPCGVRVVSAGSLGLVEPEETAADFAGNAGLKAVAAAEGSGLPALADDSGFCVAALGGAPGVVSARWAGPGRDYGAAMARVWAGVEGVADRRAWFECVLCLAWPGGEVAAFSGRVDGAVVWPPRGAGGFGYDAMFMPEGEVLTFGEMGAGAKAAVSHRARAMRKLLDACFVMPE